MLICLCWHFCYTSHFLKSRSCESPPFVNKMLRGAEAPCRRKLSAGHRPGELLLARGQAWLDNRPVTCWWHLRVPAGDGERRSQPLPWEMPTSRWCESTSMHIWTEQFRDVFPLELVSAVIGFPLDFFKMQENAAFTKNPLPAPSID